MSDADYIPANEAILHTTITVREYNELLRNRRELADALRRFMPDDKRFADGYDEVTAYVALARFDALGGNNE